MRPVIAVTRPASICESEITMVSTSTICRLRGESRRASSELQSVKLRFSMANLGNTDASVALETEGTWHKTRKCRPRFFLICQKSLSKKSIAEKTKEVAQHF